MHGSAVRLPAPSIVSVESFDWLDGGLQATDWLNGGVDDPDWRGGGGVPRNRVGQA